MTTPTRKPKSEAQRRATHSKRFGTKSPLPARKWKYNRGSK